jgi:ribosomal protein L7/L12
LNIRSVFVTDQGLASLRRLKDLQILRISLAQDVTAAGLGYLAGLQVKKLEVTYYNVSDSELKVLRKASALTTLRLMNAKKVTEAAIPYLSEMTALKDLEIVGSSLTKGHIKKLKENLPDCKIVESIQ